MTREADAPQQSDCGVFATKSRELERGLYWYVNITSERMEHQEITMKSGHTRKRAMEYCMEIGCDVPDASIHSYGVRIPIFMATKAHSSANSAICLSVGR